jgi:hypothetical protein
MVYWLYPDIHGGYVEHSGTTPNTEAPGCFSGGHIIFILFLYMAFAGGWSAGHIGVYLISGAEIGVSQYKDVLARIEEILLAFSGDLWCFFPGMQLVGVEYHFGV